MKTWISRFQPSFDRLEDRWVPAGNVTASVSFGTLSITGDLFANNIDISEVGFKTYQVTGNATTVNGGASATFAGVTNIVANMNAGDDTVTFGNQNSATITIVGSLTVNGGVGNNQVISDPGTAAYSLNVAVNLAVINANGDDFNRFVNVNVGGNFGINNGNGDTQNFVGTFQNPQANMIVGSFTLTNGAGFDDNTFRDTNVGHNVTINNGTGRVTDNQGGNNTVSTLSLDGVGNSHMHIGGNLALTNLTGDNVANFLDDFDVVGNVDVNMGSGNGQDTEFVANTTPETIGGSLTFRATGRQALLGFGVGNTPGMLIGLLNVQLGAADDVVLLRDVNVRTTTVINAGGGANQVTIDDGGSQTGSHFVGAFRVETGAGNDTVNIGAGGGEGGGITTTFDNRVNVLLGAGNDQLNLATTGNVALFGPARFDGGAGFDTINDVGAAIAAGRLTFVTVPAIVSFP
jgi:hypothetical protein